MRIAIGDNVEDGAEQKKDEWCHEKDFCACISPQGLGIVQSRFEL